MFAVADCELMGRQVGIATATDEVEDTEIDVVSVMSKWESRYNLKGMWMFLVVSFL